MFDKAGLYADHCEWCEWILVGLSDSVFGEQSGCVGRAQECVILPGAGRCCAGTGSLAAGGGPVCCCGSRPAAADGKTAGQGGGAAQPGAIAFLVQACPGGAAARA